MASYSLTVSFQWSDDALTNLLSPRFTPCSLPSRSAPSLSFTSPFFHHHLSLPQPAVAEVLEEQGTKVRIAVLLAIKNAFKYMPTIPRELLTWRVRLPALCPCLWGALT